MAWDNEETNRRFMSYAHGDKETNYERIHEEGWHEEGMSDEAQSDFRYHLYEVEFDCEVDLDTGKVRCWGVNGTPLTEPIVGI